MTKKSISNKLASFIHKLEYGEIPSPVVDVVTDSIIDTIGVGIAGSQTKPGRIAFEFVKGSPGESSLWGHASMATSVQNAALVNGTAAHSLDFDDFTRAIPGHPSVVLVPGIIALAEKTGASGEEIITAYVCGIETMFRIVEPMGHNHYQAGWHATGTIGAFGSTAACSKLMDLAEEQIRNAINIAASLSSGLRQNFGSMSKPLHAGQASSSGVKAAGLAKRGFDAQQDALDGEMGFLVTYNNGCQNLTFRSNSEDSLRLSENGLTIKKYPSCGATQTSIEAVREVTSKHNIRPDEIKSLTVTTSELAEQVLTYDNPQSGLEAKFSMEYTTARAVIDEKVGLSAFRDENIDDPEARSLFEYIQWEIDDSLPPEAHAVRVQIETISGEKIEHELKYPSGHPKNPMTDTELKEKFIMCTEPVLSNTSALKLYQNLRRLRLKSGISLMG